MKLSESIGFIPFYDKIKSKSMPISIAYKLSKIYTKVKEDETFYQEKLREILFKYGELDEEGNLIPIEEGKGIKIKPDQQNECLRAIEELQNTPSGLSFEPLSISDLDKLEITPSDLEGIIQFIEP